MSKDENVSENMSEATQGATADGGARKMDETQKLPSLEPQPGEGSVTNLELEKLKKERDELKTAYLRSLADFDNYQKRTKRENDRFRDEATRDLLKDLVLVLDNLDMTLAASKPAEGAPAAAPEATLASVTKGVEMVRDQLLRLVGQRGMAPLGTKPGDPFDADKHEAVMAVPTPGLAKDEVGLVMREGYKLGSTVLRPASVQVKKASS